MWLRLKDVQGFFVKLLVSRSRSRLKLFGTMFVVLVWEVVVVHWTGVARYICNVDTLHSPRD